MQMIKNNLVTITSMVQDHEPARRNNSIRAGIEEDPGWDDPALV